MRNGLPPHSASTWSPTCSSTVSGGPGGARCASKCPRDSPHWVPGQRRFFKQHPSHSWGPQHSCWCSSGLRPHAGWPRTEKGLRSGSPLPRGKLGPASEPCPTCSLQQDSPAGGPGGGPVHAGHPHLHPEVSFPAASPASVVGQGRPWDGQGGTLADLRRSALVSRRHGICPHMASIPQGTRNVHLSGRPA